MKILMTGMGSHHCKRPENTSFFTVLADALESYAEVIWMSPKFSWTKEDLDQFDLIVFGFIPPTSLSANKLYGAMRVLSLMFDSPKLKLVVDSPQVWQYKNSLAAVIRDPMVLLSRAYERRESYNLAKQQASVLKDAATAMGSGVWPEILYPSLPWNSDEAVADALRFVDASQITGINLDALLIEAEPQRLGRRDVWAAENQKSSWIDSIAKTIALPMEPTKVGRKTDDKYAYEIIRDSVGLLLPPQERNSITWWNYRLIQAMNTGTPIATYWPATQGFDQSWSMLAYQIEDMTPAQRNSLAIKQRESYLNAVSSADDVLKILKEVMLSSNKERI